MSLRTVTIVAASLSLLSSVAFAQGGKMMGGKMSGGKMMAGKMATMMSCKECGKSYCATCAKKMGAKDKMGHKLMQGGKGKCAVCGMEPGKMMKGKMSGGKMMMKSKM